MDADRIQDAIRRLSRLHDDDEDADSIWPEDRSGHEYRMDECAVIKAVLSVGEKSFMQLVKRKIKSEEHKS